MLKLSKNQVVKGIVVAAFGMTSLGFGYGTSSGAGLLPIEDADLLGVAIKDYKDSEAGKVFIAETTAVLQGFGYQEKLGEHFVGTACGFAGCSDSYIVTHTYIPQMVNAQAISKSFIVNYNEIGRSTDVVVEEIFINKSEENERATLSGSDRVQAVSDAYSNLESTKANDAEFLEQYPEGKIGNVRISQIDYSCGFAGCSSTYLVSKIYVSNAYPFLSEANLSIATIPLNGNAVFFTEAEVNASE